VTLPLLKPTHFFVLVISIIGALKMYDQSFIVSGGTGGPDYSTLTPVLFLVQKLVQNIQFGYAAAVGVLLFVLIFSLTVMQRLLFGRGDAA
jgi:multiple sugar transport system permease protein